MKSIIIPNKIMPQRYFTAIMLSLGLQLNYVMRFTLTIARLEMVPPKPPKVDPDAPVNAPTIDPTKEYEFDWDSHTQGLVMSSFFWGYFITQIPGGAVSDMIGGKLCCVMSTLCSSFVVALHPVLARWNVYAFIAGRVVLGLIQGFNYASLHSIFAKWIPKEERSLWGAVVFTGAQVGLIECNIITGFIISGTGRWDIVFYIGAAFAALWAIIFQLTCTSDHTFYKYLRPKEQEILDKYTESFSSQKGKRPPWKQIWLSIPVWSFVIGMIGHDWGIFAAATDIPKYLASALGLTTKDVGIWMALGYFLMVILAISSGVLNDYLVKKEKVSLRVSRIVMTTLAQTGQAVFLVSSGYSGANYTLAIALLVASIVVMGFFYPSLKMMPIDLSPNFAGTIGAIGHGIATISGIIAPYLINLMTPNGFIREWRLVFWVSMGVMVGTNIIYIFTMSAETQRWNSEDDEAKYKEKQGQEKAQKGKK